MTPEREAEIRALLGQAVHHDGRSLNDYIAANSDAIRDLLTAHDQERLKREALEKALEEAIMLDEKPDCTCKPCALSRFARSILEQTK